MHGIRQLERRKKMFLFANLFAKLFEQINLPGILWMLLEKFL